MEKVAWIAVAIVAVAAWVAGIRYSRIAASNALAESIVVVHEPDQPVKVLRGLAVYDHRTGHVAVTLSDGNEVTYPVAMCDIMPAVVADEMRKE